MEAASEPTAATPIASLEPDAFRRLYPDDYYQSFLADGIRPDGRVLGRARATAIGLDTISSVDGSALVKQGNTTVLAGVRLSIVRPDEPHLSVGTVGCSVEVAPFGSADWRPGKAAEMVASVSEHLEQVLFGRSAGSDAPASSARPGCFPLEQLCIAAGKAVWHAQLDIYVLNVDGSLLDAVLLAAVSALTSTPLPKTSVSPEGKVSRSSAEQAGEAAPSTPARVLSLRHTPLALTCTLYKEHVIVDPTADEEGLAGALVTVVIDGEGTLHGAAN
ncbi:hypothetical protein FOA52_001443 [Chlamydomonas sp. UWO 241]|nr:hypothetical protein FOA52_001443 [Chlamydomonas sp. UWO 241]